jgi:hypothetical protein
MNPDELDLVETEELVNALGRRFDAVLFAYCTDIKDGEEATQVYWRGGRILAIGLAHDTLHKITRQRPDRIDEDAT